MGELADTARRRLTSLPDPDLCPRWTTVVTRPPALELGADDVWVTPVAVLSDGDVITGNALGLVRRWRTDQPGVPAELGSQDSAVSAVAVLFDDRVVTGGGDGRVRLWRTDQPGVPVELGTHDRGRFGSDRAVAAVAALSDGRVVTGGGDGRVRLWRTDQPGLPVELGTHHGEVIAVSRALRRAGPQQQRVLAPGRAAPRPRLGARRKLPGFVPLDGAHPRPASSTRCWATDIPASATISNATLHMIFLHAHFRHRVLHDVDGVTRLWRTDEPGVPLRLAPMT